MALDILASNGQIRMLKQQSAAALHCAQLFRTYEGEIAKAWSGKDAAYFIKTLEQQICKCEELSRQMNHLACDMMQAAAEISAEVSEQEK